MIEIHAVPGLPEIRVGDDLAALIARAFRLRDSDVVVVSSKVVAKAEGAVVAIDPTQPVATQRRRLAAAEAVRVVADAPWALVVETRHGLVCANAGIDASNAAGGLVLLPEHPDDAAAAIRKRLRDLAGVDVSVIVSDTFGRPWRMGQTDVAIGVSGIKPIRDERGGRDRDGQVLDVTEVAVADEIAAAADLVRDKAAGIPVVVVRGMTFTREDTATATELIRPAALDLFRRGRGMLVRGLAELPRAPSSAGTAVTAADLLSLQTIAPQLHMASAGPPTELVIDDDVRAGLVVAALIDLGYAATWSKDDGRVTVIASGLAEPSLESR